MPRRSLFDRYVNDTKGMPSIASCQDPVLVRHTIRVEIRSEAPTRCVEPVLIDCELDWMSEERFSLTGFQQRAAHEEHPARLLRHGWLCGVHIEEAAGDVRPLRGAKQSLSDR